MNQRRRPSARSSAGPRQRAGKSRSARESAVATSQSSARQRAQGKAAPQQRAPSQRRPQVAEPEPNRPARSSQRSSQISERSNCSGRQSSRQTASAPSMMRPILVFVILAAALGAGGYYATQGEDHSIRINQLESAFNSAHKNMQESLADGSLDMAQDYYDKGSQALESLAAYLDTHQAEISSDVPNTNDKQQQLDDLKAQLPTLKKVASLRDIASSYRVQLNTLHRVYDLDALEQDIKNFRSNPPLDGITLDETAQALFNKQIGFLKDAEKTITAERQRRKNGFKKPSYKTDNRNDLQKRNERADYQGFTRNVPYKLEKNKFSDAYKTALAFHEKYPLCDIDEDWEKIVNAEDAYWAKQKQAIMALIKKGTPADIQRAQSQLSIYLDNYGNEQYGDEARKLFADCQK